MNDDQNMTRMKLHNKRSNKRKRGPILPPKGSKTILRKWWFWSLIAVIILSISGLGINAAASARNQDLSDTKVSPKKTHNNKPKKVTKPIKKSKKKKSAAPETAKNEMQNDQNNNSNSDTNTNNNSEQNTDSQYYFKDNKAVIHDIDIEITQTKVIQPGDTGNENGKKPIFAIWYKTTNKTDKDINPTTAWVAVFKATQKSDSGEEKDLEVAAQPDSRFVDTQLNTINQGDTVESAVAYALEDTSKPVTLIATKGVNGETIGSQEYQVK